MEAIETTETVNGAERNIDGELLDIVGKHERELTLNGSSMRARTTLEEVIKRQQQDLEDITDRLPRVTTLRRLLRLFFPLVEESTRIRS